MSKTKCWCGDLSTEERRALRKMIKTQVRLDRAVRDFNRKPNYALRL